MKKFLICFSFIFLLISNTLITLAITADDFDINYNYQLPDTIIEKCNELQDNKINYLVVRAKNNSSNFGIYISTLGGIMSQSVYTVKDDFYIFTSSNGFNQSSNPFLNDFFTYADVYHYKSNGEFYELIKNGLQNSCQFISIKNFEFLSSDYGVIGADGTIFMKSTSLPIWQIVKSHYKVFINTFIIILPTCFVAIIFFVGIRKGISFLSKIIRGS